MDRKADLTIEKVKKDSSGNIIEVKASIRVKDWSKGEVSLTKEDIIYLIEDGAIIFSRYVGKDGKFTMGAKINVISINNKKYLRTDPNKTAKDNLDNLPTF